MPAFLYFWVILTRSAHWALVLSGLHGPKASCPASRDRLRLNSHTSLTSAKHPSLTSGLAVVLGSGGLVWVSLFLKQGFELR